MAHHNDPDIVNRGTKPELGYDHRDVNMEKIGKVTLGFFVFTTVSIFICIPIMTLLVFGTADPRAFGKPIRSGRAPNMPPSNYPLLQTNVTNRTDIHEYRHAEDSAVKEFGVSNKAKGEYRIPIEDAIKKVAAEGLNAPAGGQN